MLLADDRIPTTAVQRYSAYLPAESQLSPNPPNIYGVLDEQRDNG